MSGIIRYRYGLGRDSRTTCDRLNSIRGFRAGAIVSKRACEAHHPRRTRKRSDVVARIVFDDIGRRWKKNWRSLMRPRRGSIAAKQAVQAPPDGYTLYLPAASAFIVMPEMFPNLKIDMVADFSPCGVFSGFCRRTAHGHLRLPGFESEFDWRARGSVQGKSGQPETSRRMRAVRCRI